MVLDTAPPELPPRVRDDVSLQRTYDEDRERREDALDARIRAALEARAQARNEREARHPYRQALVDLASWCLVLADDLEPPDDDREDDRDRVVFDTYQGVRADVVARDLGTSTRTIERARRREADRRRLHVRLVDGVVLGEAAS